MSLHPLLIATAGHVDHGKSTLVKALSGVDPDRWEEEKRRGITIDLGFAHLELGTQCYSFVDVPGHERFIHNMLAGVGSIDAVLLTIAADESIMPQTREHALALSYLGIDQVIVVISKVDLVDDETLELLHLELDEFLEPLGWASAERVSFSTFRPETTSQVVAALTKLKKKAPSQDDFFRLSVDRVFSLPGSGTVVTGTVDKGLVDGSDQLFLFPVNRQVRVRQLHMHGKQVARVAAHCRVAINLSDVHFKQLKRGYLLLGTALPQPSRRFLVRIQPFALEWEPSPKHYFFVHHLAAKYRGRLAWRSGNLAALELEQPYPFQIFDRAIVRDGSPLKLISGLQILHPCFPPGSAKKQARFLESLPVEGDRFAFQHWVVAQQNGIIHIEDLAAFFGEKLNTRILETLVHLWGGKAVLKSLWGQQKETLINVLKELHARQPFYPVLPRMLLRNTLAEKTSWDDRLFEPLLKELEASGEVLTIQAGVKRSTHRAYWPKKFEKALKWLLAQVSNGVIQIEGEYEDKDAYLQVEQFLVAQNYLVMLTPKLAIQHERLIQILIRLTALKPDVFSVGEFKDWFGYSRKVAIPLLELLDRHGCTRRVGNDRQWLGTGDQLNDPCTWKPEL